MGNQKFIMGAISKVIKRDGRFDKFSSSKIRQSIHKSMVHAHGREHVNADILAKEVVSILSKRYKKGKVEVETIKDTVEYVLVKHKLGKVAKYYILHRYT